MILESPRTIDAGGFSRSWAGKDTSVGTGPFGGIQRWSRSTTVTIRDAEAAGGNLRPPAGCLVQAAATRSRALNAAR